MSGRKDWTELGPKTREQYERALKRAYGNKKPTFVPKHDDWPESSRSILRAALQAYWVSNGDEAKGIVLARSIKRTRRVKRAKVWPSRAEADKWLATAEKTEPRGAYLLCKVCFTRGMRAEEVLSTPRAIWQSALTYGRIKFVGKGNKERVLQTRNIERTLRELLDTPGALPHDGEEAAKFKAPPRWSVPGEILARPGSSVDTQRHLLTRYIKKVAVAAGLDPASWHPHAFRHVFADRYSGGLQELQLALGHASVQTTTGYRHPTPEDVGKHFEGD